MDEKEPSKVIDKDLEIENMREFLLENQDIKLENLPRYEDLIKAENETELKTETKIEGMQEVERVTFFDPTVKPKEEPKQKSTTQKRFKIVASCFAVIGVLLVGLACINGVALAMLSKDYKDNQKDITTLTEEVTDLQNEYELTNTSGEKVSYKLALPRNYPKDTSELTWFDKLSIFLMKLF